jgi:hypothetical protein
MKPIFLLAASLFVCASIASAQGKILTNDPLTGLPLMPPRDSAKKFGNEPVQMPGATICKSKFQGNFYKLYDYFAKDNIKLTDGLAWYTSHLSGFKKEETSNHSQTIFYKPDGTIMVIVDSESHTADGVTKLNSAAYERYQPGISEKTIVSLAGEHIVCK